MNSFSKLQITILVLCVSLSVCRSNDILNEKTEPAEIVNKKQQTIINKSVNGDEPKKNGIDTDIVCNRVRDAIDKMDETPFDRIVQTGHGVINNEQVALLSVGDGSVDGLKYTALAISENGKVYYLDASKGSDWMLLGDTSIQQEKASNLSIAGMNGAYKRVGSTETNSSTLQLKYLENRMFFFELRSNPKEKAVIFSGLISINEQNSARYDCSLGGKGKGLIVFVIDREKNRVSVTHEGDVTTIPNGEYQYIDKRVSIKAETAIKFIEELPVPRTGLNTHNTPYHMECVKKESNSKSERDRFIITAAHTETGRIIAKFAVVNDLSSIYRIDADSKKPVLIFGGAK